MVACALLLVRSHIECKSTPISPTGAIPSAQPDRSADCDLFYECKLPADGPRLSGIRNLRDREFLRPRSEATALACSAPAPKGTIDSVRFCTISGEQIVAITVIYS